MTHSQGWRPAPRSWGREDLRPKEKQYGFIPDPRDEQVDPKIIEAEARKSKEKLKERGGRFAMSMRWTPGGVEHVARAHPPEPPASARPSPKKEGEGPGFTEMEFHDPPPPPPAPAFPPWPSGGAW